MQLFLIQLESHSEMGSFCPSLGTDVDILSCHNRSLQIIRS